MGLPPPWSVERNESGFKVLASNGAAVCFIYASSDPTDDRNWRASWPVAERVAHAIAWLPDLLKFTRQVRRGARGLDAAQPKSSIPIRTTLQWEADEVAELASKYGLSAKQARKLIAEHAGDKVRVGRAAAAFLRG